MTLSTISDVDIDAAFADIIAAEWPKLTGRQSPESVCYTPGDPELGRKAAELGRRSAMRIRVMPWQRWSLERILSKNPDGTWTHPECCLIVPRQAGKSLVLSLRVLYGLFKLGENIIFSAQQWETAKSLWKRTWAIVKATPWMLKHVVSHTCSQGRGTIVLESGAQVVFTTRSANAGRGLDKVDLEIYDEAYDLTEADMAALSPTKMAAGDPQTIYTSSAVNAEQHPNGKVLAAVRRRGLEGEEGLLFAEWMAPAHLDRADPKTWRIANPSYGVIQTDKKLAAELRKFSTEAGRKSFDVEYLGRGDWPSEVDEVEPKINLELWARLAETGQVRVRGPIALAVEMSNDRRVCLIAAATRTAAEPERVRVEIGYYGPPGPVVARIVDLVDRWDPCAVVINSSSPAAALTSQLTEVGIAPELTTKMQAAQAAGGLVDAATAGGISHADDPRLTEALKTTPTVPLAGGAFRWDYNAPNAIALQAVSLARWALLTYGTILAPPPTPSRGTPGRAAASTTPELDVFATAF
ncbi:MULTISPECIES: hypothetical protein [unclassified Nocardia]|uniref:hypothetical protein n=1 Tax=unclassified Nocardia TaxID=2637762 RepID=UPI00278BED3E|nr:MULTISPECIES: hypothetical protein [unclassified Nocardia]